MDDDYSTELLLASLLNDNIDDDDSNTVHTNTQQVPTNHKTHTSSTLQETTIGQPVSDSKASFDSLEDLLNATLSPSEENYSDLDKTTFQDNSSPATPITKSSEVFNKVSTTGSVGLPPKFRNTFKPVEVSDTRTAETILKSPSYVVSSQASTSSINMLTDNRIINASTDSTWQQLKNDSLFPSSKRMCLGHTSSYDAKSITAITSSSINATSSMSVNNMYSNLLARNNNNAITNTPQQVGSHPVVTTSVGLNGVKSTNSNTTTNTVASNNTIDLKRLQETNLVSELQAASNKPISSASILHAIQVVQLNYNMLLQKLNQSIDDATAQEVKTKLMVLTHHYKQLAQQYQAKLSAEKSQLSSNVPTTSITITSSSTVGSSATVTSQSSIGNMLMSSVATTTTTPFASTVIDLTHDKSVKTTCVANKETCGTVTAAAAMVTPVQQHSTNTTAGANVSSYLQSIPSLAAYLLQNTEAQKQLTPVELQQLNQIRVNLLQEFQRRQVQNFLTSLPADVRPKNVNELKDMMKEKNFSIQVSAYLL